MRYMAVNLTRETFLVKYAKIFPNTMRTYTTHHIKTLTKVLERNNPEEIKEQIRILYAFKWKSKDQKTTQIVASLNEFILYTYLTLIDEWERPEIFKHIVRLLNSQLKNYLNKPDKQEEAEAIHLAIICLAKLVGKSREQQEEEEHLAALAALEEEDEND